MQSRSKTRGGSSGVFILDAWQFLLVISAFFSTGNHQFVSKTGGVQRLPNGSTPSWYPYCISPSLCHSGMQHPGQVLRSSWPSLIDKRAWAEATLQPWLATIQFPPQRLGPAFNELLYPRVCACDVPTL